MGRGAALADGHALDTRMELHTVAHGEQAVTHPVGIRGRGEEALDDELLVVEIGEEEVLHARHAEDRKPQHGEGHDDRRPLVADQEGDRPAHEAVDRIKQIITLLFL